MYILLIEDDQKTAKFVSTGLLERGFRVDVAHTGAQGLKLSKAVEYDAMIVDRMLPDSDGLKVVEQMRSAGVRTPILFLTALDSIDDRVSGLNAGGDDYLIKPFALAELHARLCSLARRPPLEENRATLLCARDLEMDLLSRNVFRAGVEIELLPTEFRLLQYFLERVRQVVTKRMLLEDVWGFSFDPKTSVVETHISRLRAKIDARAQRPLIGTVRGVGYLVDESSFS